MSQGGSLGSWRLGKAYGGSSNIMKDAPLSCPARCCVIEVDFLKVALISDLRRRLYLSRVALSKT